MRPHTRGRSNLGYTNPLGRASPTGKKHQGDRDHLGEADLLETVVILGEAAPGR